MKILVDTSVWIESFRRSPQIDIHLLSTLLEKRQLVLCYPVLAELYSGAFSQEDKSFLKRTLMHLEFISVDWNHMNSWKAAADFSDFCFEKKIQLPGFLDRMILACAQENQVKLWTLDKKLKNLAAHFGLAY